jgi:hypothetical protein
LSEVCCQEQEALDHAPANPRTGRRLRLRK